MSSLFHLLKAPLRLLLGGSQSRTMHNQDMLLVNNYTHSINAFAKGAGDKQQAPQDEPIFIFSAGWRSGSTLLQRLISSDEKLLLWGEPYDRCNLVQQLSESLCCFNGSWPPQEYFLDEKRRADIGNSWIANLYPEQSTLLAAHRAFFDTLFAQPAKNEGATRWGMKEVRFGLQEALYLKLLYPRARFLYLHRDLTSAYLSYKSFRPEMTWYSRWPKQKAFTPYAFARHRARLLREFKQAQQLAGGVLIDYAQLVPESPVFATIEEYTGVKCDQSVLPNKVGSGRQKQQQENLGQLERLLLTLGDHAPIR